MIGFIVGSVTLEKAKNVKDQKRGKMSDNNTRKEGDYDG